MEDQDLVTPMPELLQAPLGRRLVRQEVGDQDHQAPPLDPCSDLIERPLGRRLLSWRVPRQDPRQPRPVGLRRARWDPTQHALGETDQADGVPLTDQQEREAGRQALRVIQLGEKAVLAAPPVHRATHIQTDVGGEIGLLFVLLQVEPVGAPIHLPVDEPEVVARAIGPVLGELDGEPSVRRPMESGEEALDDRPGDQLQAAERVELGRVQQVGSTGSSFVHSRPARWGWSRYA